MKRIILSAIIALTLIFTVDAMHSWADAAKKVTNDTTNEALSHEVEANKLDDAGKLDEAINEYETSLGLNPYSVSCLFNLGVAYLKAERFEEAVYTYERAVDLDAKDAELFKLLGIAYVKDGKKKQAVLAWDKSLELNPEQPQVKQFLEANK